MQSLPTDTPISMENNNGTFENAYCWRTSGSDEPGAVLALVSGVQFDAIPYWPSIGAFDIDIRAAVGPNVETSEGIEEPLPEPDVERADTWGAIKKLFGK